MISHWFRFLAVPVLVSCIVPVAGAQSPQWIRQLGTADGEHLYAAAEDGSGGVFLGGPISVNGGSFSQVDLWIARYDRAGTQLWWRQYGTTTIDALFAATSDGAGGVLTAGYTDSTLAGPNAGGYDAWIIRFDGAGLVTWATQFGSPDLDFAYALAPDGTGGAFLSGNTTGSFGGPHVGGDDAWVGHCDNAGVIQWVRQLGSPETDYVKGSVADGAGGVYVCGETWGSLTGSTAGYMDGWLARFDATGALLWSLQIGTSGFEYAHAVTLDGTGGVFVAGGTTGSLGGPPHGNYDVWVARYDGAGTRQWITQFGEGENDQATSLVLDGCGGLFVCGQFGAALGGSSGDALIARLDGTGALLSLTTLGTPNEGDKAWVTAPDGAGGLFVGGDTFGALAAPHQGGGTDCWVARYRPCEGTGDVADNGLNANSLCPGDNTIPGLVACPCGNFGASGRGCMNSAVAAGAYLGVSGATAPDTVTLTATGMPASTTAIFVKGDAYLAGGSVFGDGVRCVDGNLLRLGTVQAAGGSAQFPVPGGPSVSVRGQTPPGSALSAVYQTSYRNAVFTFCPPAAFNVTQAIAFTW